MCYNCGCKLPNDPMSKGKISKGGASLTEDDFAFIAEKWEMGIEDVKKDRCCDLGGAAPGGKRNAVGARSGLVYDGLILKCAERAGVETVYTWNTSHFQRIAWAGIADRVREP